MPSGIISPTGERKASRHILPLIIMAFVAPLPASRERGWGEGSLLLYLQGNLNPPGHLHNLEENLKFVIDQILP
jgi:hypothetical protein